MFYFVRTTLAVKISEKFCRREKKDVYSLDIVYFTSFDAPCYLITLLCVVTSFSFFASERSVMSLEGVITSASVLLSVL